MLLGVKRFNCLSCTTRRRKRSDEPPNYGGIANAEAKTTETTSGISTSVSVSSLLSDDDSDGPKLECYDDKLYGCYTIEEGLQEEMSAKLRRIESGEVVEQIGMELEEEGKGKGELLSTSSTWVRKEQE
jgi:hypothetical protein